MVLRVQNIIMKNLKYLFLLAASILFVACSGDEEDIPNDEKPDSPPQPEIIVENLPDGVEIGEETQQLNNIQLENIENVDEENSTLTFSSALPSDQIPQKGQIILQLSFYNISFLRFLDIYYIYIYK